MTWARLDDGLHCHPKVLALGKDLPALALWVLGLSYCAQHKTDGILSRAAATRLCGSENITPWAAALLRVGLWKRARGGWRYHDYTDYNFDRKTLEQRQAGARARQQAYRQRQEAGHALVTRDERVGQHVTNASVTVPLPDPSRPCTSKEVQVVGGRSTRSNQPATIPKIAVAIRKHSNNGQLPPELVAKLHAAHPEKTPAQIIALFAEAHA